MLRQDHSYPILFFGLLSWGLLPILTIFSDMRRIRILRVVWLGARFDARMGKTGGFAWRGG
jgi:hypothetical protein